MANVTLCVLCVLGVTAQACELPERWQDEDTPLEHAAEEKISKLHEGDVEIITIDGCEYIIYEYPARSNLGFGFMAHKGNCKNPIHVYTTAANRKSSSAHNSAKPPPSSEQNPQ